MAAEIRGSFWIKVSTQFSETRAMTCKAVLTYEREGQQVDSVEVERACDSLQPSLAPRKLYYRSIVPFRSTGDPVHIRKG